ncbi:LOW QUALITY PROTEIN: uncharacterized protein [Diadema setosum]|uniref:LOW QUALITY PROTEIN: uncharacterized protein n=1 Tax=Diadema setosum TaxID=31175 RepID=UPI003B3A2688
MSKVPSQQSLEKKQVQQCKEELKKYYSESCRTVTVHPLNIMERVDLDEIYTNLSLLDRSNLRKTPITYEDILDNDESGHFSKRILIQGEGGVGKTTLCAKIAWDWCQGRILQDLDMVIKIPLRDVTSGRRMSAIVKSYLSDSNAATLDQIDGYISTNLSRILLVLDGYDEFGEDIEEGSKSEVIQILALEQYESCKVIVTTRPWKSHHFQMTKKLTESYVCISLDGFTEKDLTIYTRRYFMTRRKDTLADSLIMFMEENDIIRSNMAPFPIYCAMLCLMWEECSEKRRKEMTKLQTFTEFFGAMIFFLKEHYAAKVCVNLHDQEVADHLTEAGRAMQDISEIALNGLLERTPSFSEEHFKECHDAMETCCRVGVLTIEKDVTRDKRLPDISSLVESVVSFPHQMFQQYVAGLYIAIAYAIDRAKYDQLKHKLLSRYQEFRYLLYFASAFGNEIGLDIINSLLEYNNRDFCVDVAFECHTVLAIRAVGDQWKEYELSWSITEHTKSGVLFMIHCDQVRSLYIDEVECGRTASRDLAVGMCCSGVLRKVTIKHSKFYSDFYTIIGDKASTCQIEDVRLFIKNWDDGSKQNSSIGGDLAKWVFTIPTLSSFSLECSYLDGDFLSTAVTSASSCQIQYLKLSLELWDDCSKHQSSIGDDLAQWVFTLPNLLTFNLRCPYLDNDFLSTAISSATSCQIQDLKLSVDRWYGRPEYQSSKGADLTQWVFTLPSLSSFSLRCFYLDGDFLSTAIASASSCQIQDLTLNILFYDRRSNVRDAPSSGKALAQCVCSLPRLLTFRVTCYYLLDDDFFSTAAMVAQSCQIRKLSMQFIEGWTSKSASAATKYAEFLCHMPHLEKADITCPKLPDTFFKGMASQPTSCKLKVLNFKMAVVPKRLQLQLHLQVEEEEEEDEEEEDRVVVEVASVQKRRKELEGIILNT